MAIKKKNAAIYILRAILVALILLNLKLIFGFSAQSGEESSETSEKVATVVAEVTVKDFEEKPEQEQKEIVQKLHKPVRKAAHMTEFGSLGALFFLLLLTFGGKRFWKPLAAVGFSFAFACADEISQNFSDSRGPQFTDVLIDTSGAILTCTLIFLVLLLCDWIRRQQALTVTHYAVDSKGLLPKKMAVVSDLHDSNAGEVLAKTRAESPDCILIVGDLTDGNKLRGKKTDCLKTLREFASIAPTFYSLGNHELCCYHKGNPWRYPSPVLLTASDKKAIADTGAVLLDNEITEWNGILICGLTSGANKKTSRPNEEILRKFAKMKGYHVLLCHHPEYYVPYIRNTGIELTLCGHAHGGQWRFFGRGVYSPGQGLFPKYTSGTLDGGRCIISRGVGTHTRIPRLWNPPELIILDCI